jgi:hypothetical protein
VLVALGLAILASARAARRHTGRVNRYLWPRHPGFARVVTGSGWVFGVAVGLAAVAVGAVLVAGS